MMPQSDGSLHATVHLRILHDRQIAIKESKAKRKMVRAGRRGGKTVLAGDETVDNFLDGRRVLYATPTSDQLTKWWFEVTSALKEPIEAGAYYVNHSTHVIEVPGTENRIRGKTAWNASTLRGDYADFLILDEVQLMSEDAWGEVGLPMLLDNDGSALLIYTPPSLRSNVISRAQDKRWVPKLFKRMMKDTSGRWECFHFTSHDNPHISKVAVGEISKDMSKVAYRQEILAEDVDEAPGALWTRDVIERNRRDYIPKNLRRVAVAVDPALSTMGNEAGIIGGGWDGTDDGFYVFEDVSKQGSPLEWAMEAVLLYVRIKADFIVIEKNAGGEMNAVVIKSAIQQLLKKGKIKKEDAIIRLVKVDATRGKATRADPISVMYEADQVHHVGDKLGNLEDELCLWTPEDTHSPNRLDALVWLIWALKNQSGDRKEDFDDLGELDDYEPRFA